MRRFVTEFKEFALKGDFVDLATGIIIGAATTGVVTSLVNDIIMPPIGMVLGRVDMKALFITLDGRSYPSLAVAKAKAAPVIGYGAFINSLISFAIIALVVFLIIKLMSRLRRKDEEATEKACPYCATEIPVAALRCPHCTSHLVVDAERQAQG
jgi:large conductance mechanosensitive channel